MNHRKREMLEYRELLTMAQRWWGRPGFIKGSVTRC